MPPGVPNYVTPQGLEQLHQEHAELEASRSKAEAARDDEAERTRQLTILNSQLSALNARISSARVIDPKDQPKDEVRFGATVTLQTLSGGKTGFTRTFTIVGVDEASVEKGLIAFVAPIAQAVQGLKEGEKATLQFGRNKEEVLVKEIRYTY